MVENPRTWYNGDPTVRIFHSPNVFTIGRICNTCANTMEKKLQINVCYVSWQSGDKQHACWYWVVLRKNTTTLSVFGPWGYINVSMPPAVAYSGERSFHWCARCSCGIHVHPVHVPHVSLSFCNSNDTILFACMLCLWLLVCIRKPGKIVRVAMWSGKGTQNTQNAPEY